MQRLLEYFRDSRKELKKVSWPNREESINLTIRVIVFSVVFAGFMGLIDLLLAEVIERVI